MKPVRREIESILAAAVEMDSEVGRREFLDQACAGDADLKRRIEELMENHFRAGSFLESPAADLFATADDRLSEHSGTLIGPYKLLEQIGEGGFGIVFMAEQQHPVRRKVALKVIKPGMDSKQIIARFEAERQALALMDHQNIARVLDAGATDSGRPYFIMELVRGIPITQFCDDNRLTLRERQELFLAVCQAVQHAHQKGIIHRDLKPSNVLVTLHDGTPVVKVIDFGIAKALGQQRLTDKTLVTGFAQMIGTPLYMSPEQAEMTGLDADTRTDIYSLGVLLYELLTGTTPFDKDRLKEASYEEIRRIIREEEPAKPSTRISTLGQAAATVSANRKSEPRRLSQLFRGELDWIVMKALEKDRNRRYDTASSFAADVQRYLHDEPVSACPPSALYRFRKFGRRNKAALAVAGLVLFFIAILGVAAGWYQREQALRIAALAARQADTERSVTAAVVQAEAFLEEGQTDHPERWQATARLAQSALEKAEELLAAGAGTDELTERVQQVRATVDVAVADSRLLVELDHIRLEQASVKIKGSRYDKARAAPLYAELLGNYGVHISKPEAAAARVRGSRLREALLAALGDWRRITPDEGERQRLEEVLRASEPPDAFRARWRAAARRRDATELVGLSKEPSLQRLAPAAVVDLALDLQEVKEWAAAERLLRAAQERNPGDFWVNHDLGRVLLSAQPHTHAEQAVGFLRVALALRSDSAVVHCNLGIALSYKMDCEGAIREYQCALRIDPKYADAHKYLSYALENSGEQQRAIQEMDAAIREYREAIRLGPKDAVAHYNLGVALLKKDVEAAGREFQFVLHIEPNDVGAHNYLGLVLQTQGRLDDSIAEFREAIRIDPKSVTARNHLAGALYEKHDLDAAIQEWRAAIQIDPKNPLLHSNLGSGLAAKRDWEGAFREYRESIHIEPTNRFAPVNLAMLALDGGDQEESIRRLRTAIRTEPELAPVRQYFFNAWAWRLATAPDPSARDPRRAVELAKEAIQNASQGMHYFGTLGVAYYRAGDFPAAVTELEKSIELRAIDPTRCNYAMCLAMAHWQLGHKAKAKQWYDQAVQWIDKHHLNPNDDDMRRFRVEAEELLGLSGGAGRKTTEK